MGCYHYIIEWRNDIKYGDSSCRGLCDHENLKIYLSNSLRNNEDLLIETLIHEIVHGIEQSSDIHLGEKKVNMLGMAVTALIKDNKNLFKSIIGYKDERDRKATRRSKRR